MQVTSLNGTSYESRKRTDPRNHQADLIARKHYETRADRRPFQFHDQFRGWIKIPRRIIETN